MKSLRTLLVALGAILLGAALSHLQGEPERNTSPAAAPPALSAWAE